MALVAVRRVRDRYLGDHPRGGVGAVGAADNDVGVPGVEHLHPAHHRALLPEEITGHDLVRIRRIRIVLQDQACRTEISGF